MGVLNLVQRVLEPLPIRGKGRIADQILLRTRTEELTCHPLGALEVHLRRSQRIERLMWAGAYERDVVRLLKKIVKPGMTIIDVGANIGYIAAIAAKLTGSQGQVFAFEPNPNCYALLAKNLRPFSHAHAYRSAIGERSEVLPFYLSGDAAEDGWGSLQRQPGAVRPIIDVSVDSIDSFASNAGLQRIEVIKLDIEGNEMRALRGARSVIERDHPAIISELNPACLARDGHTPNDVTLFLAELGYSIHRLDRDNIYAA
jgi:FkbM family methyltransferase